jgi:hypothetical protein|tara:strand:+ start:520 stop:714 length:195 start_codon:yes stop_codon:yes gene_type:complete
MTNPYENEKVRLSKAITNLNVDARYKYFDEDIDTIEWLDGTTPIAKEDILAEQKRLQDIEDAKS